MVRQLCILVVLGMFGFTAFTQKVEIIKQYGNYLAADMVVGESGHIYICGANNDHPILIKLDTNGNEKWIKQYPQDQVGYSFTRMILDSNENVYLHGILPYNRYKNFICKIDSQGIIQWHVPNQIGVYTGAAPENCNVNITLYGNKLSIIHNNRNMIGAPHDTTVLSQFNIYTGELENYVEFTDMLDKHLHRNSPPPFKNGKWIFSGFSGVLELGPNGDYNYIELGDSIPGNLIGATEDGSYYTFESKQVQKFSDFEQWQTTLFTFNANWTKIDSSILDKVIPPIDDTLSLSAFKIIRTINKGLVVAGFHDLISDTTMWGNSYFSQLNPDNLQPFWDTIIAPAAWIPILKEYKNGVLAILPTEFGNYGIMLCKINLPTLNYQTGFITSITPIIERGNSMEIDLFPNPSSRTFKVESNHYIKSITIYDLEGALIKSKTINSNSTYITIESKGIFILKIENSKGQIQTEKIVIN